MKIIKYKFISASINHGTEENPNIERIFLNKTISYSEANEEIAKKEAHNGKYTIEDDGIESLEAPSELDKLDARLTYLEIMTGGIIE